MGGTYIPGEELKVRTGSCIWGSPLTRREISGDRGWALRTGSTEWHLHRRFMPQPRVPQPLPRVHQCRSGLDAGPWGWEHKPREGTTVGCEETAWGGGDDELHKCKCLWKKPGPPQKQSAITEWCAKARAATEASFFRHRLLPSRTLGRAPPGAVSCAPAITNPIPVWVTLVCSPPNGFQPYPRTIPPGRPNRSLRLFLPDRLVCSGNL